MKKITKTCLRIHKELLEQYKDKPIEDITIKSICENLGIPRTTFYYHYDSPKAVLMEIEDIFLKNLSEIYDADKVMKYLEHDPDRFVASINDVKEFCYRHFDTLRLLLYVRPDLEFEKRWIGMMKPHYKAKHASMELNIEILVSSIMTMFKYAVGNKVPKEALHPERLLAFMFSILYPENRFIG